MIIGVVVRTAIGNLLDIDLTAVSAIRFLIFTNIKRSIASPHIGILSGILDHFRSLSESRAQLRWAT